MLRKLQNRLRAVLIAVFMAIVTLILAFSFQNTLQARKTADITYIQRMASLLIYELEADPESPTALLSYYERETQVYSILKDASGSVLFQSSPETSENLEALAEKVGAMSAETAAASADGQGVTQQGGCVEITGDNRERYLAVPADIRTQAGDRYFLTLFYRQPSMQSLLLKHLPPCCAIWLLALGAILFVSRVLLRRAFEPTERMLQSQKDFVAAASHELKSPLAVIMANVETIQNAGQADSRTQKSLSVIDTECVRMAKLVRDMLFLAASDADKWTIQTEEVNIDTLLITLYEAYEPVCRKKSIRLQLRLRDESYPPLQTDSERLFQILSVFLDNAAAYSPKGSAIELETRQTAKELTFLVIDHGPGIAGKDKPFLFDRFYRADPSRTDKSHFGLGLSVARELARMLSGKIGFEDTPGGGATFFLTLPVKAKAQQ